MSGIASMGDLKRVGRVGLKALIYFEVLTTLALVIGLLVANIAEPGVGMHDETSAQEKAKISTFTEKAHDSSTVTFLMNIVPKTFVGAFTDESVLPALFLAILVSIAMCQMQERGQIVLELLHAVGEVFFKLVAMITRVAPIAAFGAMAFTVGSEGPGTLVKLAKVLGCVYVTCALFVFVVLGLITRFYGFSLWKILVFIKDELLLVLGTSSSETALPQLMQKLEKHGCDKSVVGVVIPSGYSFNLDGTCIYLTLAALFVAQATNTHLTLWQQLGLLAVLLLTSKGAAGVTGAGFITLVATLSTIDTGIPVAGLAMLIGIDRFMSEARALTNLVGNTVATLVVAKWENGFDAEKGRMLL
ncbi:MAG TPA: C4-dicarboxylate transporter DctA, partial [Prosthecobacter sp.]|nr:C4-dicarboxylate transporter DctA [Prosthecobacter sp.]